MEKTQAEENRTAYDDFLTRLDKILREGLGMRPAPPPEAPTRIPLQTPSVPRHPT